MSRKADDDVFPDVVKPSKPARGGRRTSLKALVEAQVKAHTPKPQIVPDAAERPEAARNDAPVQGAVTRDEMVKLFGNALKVR